MSDDDQRRGLSRRQLLILSAAGGVSAMGVGSGLDADGEDGTLIGGKMALSQAFNVAGDLWVGPDSAKSGVSADSGRMYFASDTQLTYYGDGGSWVSLGIGTSGNKAPASYFQSLTTERASTASRDPTVVVHKVDGTTVVDGPGGAISYTGADADAIQAALDSLTAGRTTQETVKCIGSFTIDSQIDVPNHVVMDNRHAEFTNGGGIANTGWMFDIGETNVDTLNVSVFGGVYDGDKTGTANTPGAVRLHGDYNNTLELRSWLNGLHIKDWTSRGLRVWFRRPILSNISVVNCGSVHAMDLTGSDFLTYGLLVKDSDENGIKFNADWSTYYYTISHGNAEDGIFISTSNQTIRDGMSEFNGHEGIKVDIPSASDERATFTIKDFYLIRNNQNDATFPDLNIQDCLGGLVDTIYVIDTTTTSATSVLLGSDAKDVRLRNIQDRLNDNGGISDSGTRTMLNGRYISPPTLIPDSSGRIIPKDNGLDHYVLKVDAGGAADNLDWLAGLPNDPGIRATLIHTGGEAVTIRDDVAGVSKPFKNQGGGDVVLDANGEIWQGVNTGSAWRQTSDNTQA